MNDTRTVLACPEPGPPATLDDLATQINEHHRQAELAIRSGLDHALAAGTLLLEAKDLCQHGEWGDWLDANFEGSQRTARAYMQVARRWPEVEAKRQHVAVLGLRDAVKLLATPRPEEPADQRPLVAALDGQQHIWLIFAFGKMLNWAQERGAMPHKLAHWLCPNEGWMNQERYRGLFDCLLSGDTDHLKALRKAFGKWVTDYELVLDTARFCAKVPFTDFPGRDGSRRIAVVSMCDVVIGCVKHDRKEPCIKNPFGFLGCANWRPECLFGVIDQEQTESGMELAAEGKLEDWQAELVEDLRHWTEAGRAARGL